MKTPGMVATRVSVGPRRPDPDPDVPAAAVGAASLVAPVLAGVIAAGFACYILTQPGALHGVTQYDDGAYYGAAVRLVDGFLPYRDFAFVQPPGIVLLLSPFALLTKAAGTADGLAVARYLTAFVAGMNAFLAAYCVRHRGLAAALVAGAALACYPAAFFADRTLLLEPYLIVFCLAAVAVAFPGGRLGSERRMLAAGLLLGVAATVKTFAAVPFLALVVVAVVPGRVLDERELPVAGGLRRGVAPLVAGAAIGFGAPCLPFFLAAPGNFLHEVLTAQLGRVSVRHALEHRLAVLVGLHGLSGVVVTGTLAVTVAAALAAVLVAGSAVPSLFGAGSRLETFALLASVGSVASVLASGEFYDHYAYFPAAFVVLVLGCVAARVAAVLSPANASARAALAAVVLLAAGVGGYALLSSEATYETALAARASDPAAALDAAIPAGACVLSDAPILLIVADRFESRDPSCPPVADPAGEWLTFGGASAGAGCSPVSAALVRRWERWLSLATYFVPSSSFEDRLPWTAGMARFFSDHYARVLTGGPALFERRAVPVRDAPVALRVSGSCKLRPLAAAGRPVRPA